MLYCWWFFSFVSFIDSFSANVQVCAKNKEKAFIILKFQGFGGKPNENSIKYLITNNETQYTVNGFEESWCEHDIHKNTLLQLLLNKIEWLDA